MSVDDQLKRFDIADAAIAKMGEQYLPLKIAGVTDAAGFKAVHDARMTVKSKRVEVEKVRKVLKKDALEYGRKVDAEAKRITGLLEPIESHLKTQEDAYQAERERIRNAAKLKAEAEARAKAEAEAAKLKAEQEAEAARIKAEQDVENERLRIEREKLEAERREIQAKREAEEKKQREAQEKLDAERRALEAEQKRLADIEAERVRKEELEKAKAEAAKRAKREAEERIVREAAEAKAKAIAEENAKKAAEAARPDREKLATVAAVIRGVDVPAMSTQQGAAAAVRVHEIIRIAAKRVEEIASSDWDIVRDFEEALA